MASYKIVINRPTYNKGRWLKKGTIAPIKGNVKTEIKDECLKFPLKIKAANIETNPVKAPK